MMAFAERSLFLERFLWHRCRRDKKAAHNEMPTVHRGPFCRFMIFAIQKLAKLQKMKDSLHIVFSRSKRSVFGVKKQEKEGCKILLFRLSFLCKSGEPLYGL